MLGTNNNFNTSKRFTYDQRLKDLSKFKKTHIVFTTNTVYLHILVRKKMQNFKLVYYLGLNNGVILDIESNIFAT